MKDERCLCNRCRNEMQQAGYRVFGITTPDDINYKSACFKCDRFGYWYEVKEQLSKRRQLVR